MQNQILIAILSLCKVYLFIYFWEISLISPFILYSLAEKALLDSDVTPFSQKMLQSYLERLKREKQEAEKMGSDFRKEISTWKVGGDIS